MVYLPSLGAARTATARVALRFFWPASVFCGRLPGTPLNNSVPPTRRCCHPEDPQQVKGVCTWLLTNGSADVVQNEGFGLRWSKYTPASRAALAVDCAAKELGTQGIAPKGDTLVCRRGNTLRIDSGLYRIVHFLNFGYKPNYQGFWRLNSKKERKGACMRARQVSLIGWSIALLIICVSPLAASDTGSLIVRVSPKETYIYADGEPIYWSKGHYVTLAAGEHKIDLYNYGYLPATRQVTIVAHKTTIIDVSMQQSISRKVNGPWGCITIEGPHGAAVLLNGTTPEAFFVGNIKEFDNEHLWKKELIVPPGTHQLTIAYAERAPWTTAVQVKANQRVVVQAFEGVRKTVPWSRGHDERLRELEPFHGGLLSDHVAIEKVTGQFASSTGQVSCGDSANLTWSSTGAAQVRLNGAAVSASGNETVQPKETTTYKLTAAGPGGVYTSDATVAVNNSINASLNVSPDQLSYDHSGQQDTATVTWSASGADSVTVDPLGSVGSNGSREIQISPTDSSSPRINQTVTYTLHATNACGGTETRTATLHLMGTVQSAANEATLENKLSLTSLYFPTDLPTRQDPDQGLVDSQRKRMDEFVSDFKQYLSLRPNTQLILGAHADVRDTVEYNQALSQRRADLVKAYLVEHGIPADKIDTRAYGKEDQLSMKEVEDLVVQDPDVTPDLRQKAHHLNVIVWWANNRRVDLRLSTGLTSERYFPYNSKDAHVLMEVKEPSSSQLASLK
jgi:outer membrane protein OmpA-like peptidoglycan-associated protein